MKSIELEKLNALPDDVLTEAFHILFDEKWKKYWSEHDKAREMKSIFTGGTQPCRPFVNWVNCINFLQSII